MSEFCGGRAAADKDSTYEPIAIIGMSCRFPGGATSPEAFWHILHHGVNAVTEVPQNRWSKHLFYHPDKNRAGKIYAPKGGFLDNIDKFDPEFFRISPREAAYMDPQQRLLLETTWEAIEHGGIDPRSLAGSKTGVFIGLFMHDYENIHSRPSERRLKGPHSATGMSATIAANRISYIYDFKGPSMVIDTACSSSLIAIHLACQSLRANESELAVTGGANVIINPEIMMSLCRATMVSPDGYSKAFDAAANGYARGEGAGIVVLKKLSEALKSGDPIWAVIKSSSTNQDGKTGGQTVPSRESQETAIEKAINDAGIEPKDIDYFEAHGTGTPVGDPIEARAIGTVLSKGRGDKDTCLIGSLKTNIGHLESAAGVAGIIKVALMLKYKQIPPNLHFETPNPNIPFEALKIRVPTCLENWPKKNGKPRVAGVNSFGFGGSNACAIIEEFPGYEKQQTSNPKYSTTKAGHNQRFLVPLSAHTPDALKALANSCLDFIDSDPKFSLANLGYTCSLRKGHHANRLAMAATTKEELKGYLKAYLNGEKLTGMSSGQVIPNHPFKIAFIYSGMGQQWWAMGRELLEHEPVFKKSLEECDTLFRAHTKEWSLIAELTRNEKESRIHETRIAQPAIFALQIGLTALWRSRGIVPEAITGHSVGEVAASWASGILSLKDAVAVCFHRSRLQQTREGRGKMLAVGLSAEDTKNILALYEDKVSIAAINSPHSITLAGDAQALEDIAGVLEEEKIFVRFLKVEVPYHSHIMDPILPELKSSLENIKPEKGTIPFYSTITGNIIDGEKINADYWCRNVREPVSFQKSMNALSKNGHHIFIEIGAHPVLAMSIKECLDESGQKEMTILPSLRRKEPENLMLFHSLGQLYCLGYPIPWESLYQGDEHFVELPSYPWQRESYWIESDESKQARIGIEQDQKKIHPLIGEKIKSAVPTWKNNIDLWHLPYLKDHLVQGSMIYPAAAYIEMGVASARDTFGDTVFTLEEIEIKTPLLLTGDSDITLQVCFNEHNTFSIYSQNPGNQEWISHLKGNIEPIDNQYKSSYSINISDIENRCDKTEGKKACYKRFHALGLEYGPDFQLIERVRMNKKEALAEIKASDEIKKHLKDYTFHPAMLDACFQTLAAMPVDGTYIPVKIKSLTFFGQAQSDVFSYARITLQKPHLITGDIFILDGEGNVLAEIKGLHCQYIEGTRKREQDKSIKDNLYDYQWILKPRAGEMSKRDASEYLPSPDYLYDKVQKNIPDFIKQYNRKKFYTLIEPKLDALCLAYIVKAFKELGYTFDLQSTFSTDDLAQKLKVAKEHRRLFNRLLEILEQEHIIKKERDEKDHDGWKVISCPEDIDPQKAWNEILSEHPDQEAELILLGRCGSKLAGILRQEEDPLSIIFSSESSIPEHLYQNSPTIRIYNRLIEQSMATITDNLPEGQTLRILEIGAGTGSLSSYVLPLLPEYKTDYVFTDISAAFTARAEQKFKAYDFVDYKLLDIEKDPVEQGFDAHSFDLVLTSDAIHATENLHHTLGNVKKLLTSNGILILLEATKSARWFDLVWGTLKGWWLFSDLDIRPDHATMPKNKWMYLLNKNGFHDVAMLSDDIEGYESLHTVFMARLTNDSAHEEDYETKRVEISKQTPMPLRGTTKHENRNLFSEQTQKRKWVILSDGIGLAEQLAAEFQQRAVEPVIVNKEDPLEERDISSSPALIHMCSIGDYQEHMNGDLLEKLTHESCNQILDIVRKLSKQKWPAPPLLRIITRATQTAGNLKNLHLEQTPLWGLGRVLISEHPEWDVKLIDLSPDPSGEEIESLWKELCSDNREDEIVLRGQKRYVHTLVRRKEAPACSCAHIPFKVYKQHAKSSEDFLFQESERKKPDSHQIEIQVKALGLNFKDMARATGLLDTEFTKNGLITGLGLEYSGVVVDTGDKVKNFKTGDEVIGFASNCMANYIIADSRLAVRKPSFLSFEEAATMPLVFLTGYYALHELARIKKSDRVLIHTATGGIGLSAIQIARNAGAEIFATAGNSEKRDFLKAMGITYAGSSRSLDFYDEIMRITEGEGVDIVINTLPDKRMFKSLSLLKPVTGRFIDLSNIYNETELKMDVFQKGLSCFAFDLENIAGDNPGLIESIWTKIIDDLESKKIHPLPYRAFPIADITSAFQYMKSSHHIGKIVLSLEESGATPVPTQEKMDLAGNATYLLTGGLGGFGLAAAKWLVSCGAKHLVLLGRSGDAKPEAQKGVQTLRDMGAEVFVGRVDVTRESEVKSLLSGLEKTMPPLRGIIHAAMVLEDTFLDKMTASQMKKTLDPKVLGAWNLHNLTLDKKLDFFICFSSFSSLVGNPGQGNYAAGNSFLDSLSYYRKAHGLPSLTICWGPIADVGYVARHDEIKEYFQRQGITELTLNQAWTVIRYGLDKDITHIGIMSIDWKKFRKYLPLIKTSPRFSQLLKQTGETDVKEEILQDTKSKFMLPDSPDEVKRYLTEVLTKVISGVLRVAPSKLHPNQALDTYGLDSLMAVELNVQLKELTGVDLPKMALLQKDLTIDGLAALIQKSLPKDPEYPIAADHQKAEREKSDDIDNLSEEELDKILVTM